MIEIIPAILPKNFFDVEEKVEAVHAAVKTVQIDICDGHFTPKPSWPYNRHGDGAFKELIAEKRGLPFWDTVDFELDMMVKNPLDVIEDWMHAGVRRFIVHVESVVDIAGLIERVAGVSELGLAISLDTSLEVIAPFVDTISVLQCMGIKKIGYQGQVFDIRVVDRVARLREMFPELTISVDGGVNVETGAALVRAGVSRLVVGSAIFESDDVLGTISTFKHLK